VTDLRSVVAASGGLCTISDLAGRWGITKQWARVLVRRASFPEPILTEGGQELYPADEADDAYAGHLTRQYGVN
jgi:hypothetical protein